MSKFETIKQKANVAEEVARKIWLAGLGAYGKSFDEIQERYEDANTEATKLFQELVVKGEKLEAETKEKILTKKDETESKVKARVAEVRGKLA